MRILPSHRAPTGALCEGTFLVVQWYAYSSFWKIMTCISSYTHLITPATKYKNVFRYSGKIRLIEPQGINGHRRPVPGAPAAVHPGRARQCSGMGPCGYCRRVSIRGKFVLSRNPGYKTRGVAMWLNIVLTPGSLPRSQCSGTEPSASCGYCCLLCPAGVQYSRKIRYIDRTSQKQYTRSLVLPSWRHEIRLGALCKGIIHTLRIELL